MMRNYCLLFLREILLSQWSDGGNVVCVGRYFVRGGANWVAILGG
jgi:hypothetical protein